jgi:branched-chain amino acid transport system permease protein
VSGSALSTCLTLATVSLPCPDRPGTYLEGSTPARPGLGGKLSYDLLLNAVMAGILLGGFYAAVTVGISVAFGILDIVNIAHPAFIILGAYVAYLANTLFGVDPIAASIIALPVFYGLGALIYQVYHLSFEKRGREGQDSLRGLAFFFGLLFITEVTLVLEFGVDYRYVQASYIEQTWHVGVVDLPLRMLVPCVMSLMMLAVLQVFLTRTFMGRAIMAVAQDQFALRLMAADPVSIKRVAFAISIATASLAGAFLIIIQPVEPSMGRDYIGLVFAICVLGGLGSLAGTLIAAMLLGIAESFTATFYGPSWAPAVSFGLLLLTLAFRPSGIMGR